MTEWKHHLKLKDLLGVDEDDDTVREIAGEFAKRIRSSKLLGAANRELIYIIEDFEDLTTTPQALLINEFNWILNELYDWADDNKVWID